MIHVEVGHGKRPTIVLTRETGAATAAWAHVQLQLSRGIVDGGTDHLQVRTEVFLSELAAIREVRTFFGETLDFGPLVRAQLATLAQDRRSREDAVNSSHITSEELENELKTAKFARQLKSFQLSNLARISTLPHGADFSVPGAGKTTVALANYALQRSRKIVDRLLVIGPIAAFEAWKTDMNDCFLEPPQIFVHTGSNGLFMRETEVVLTNYNRVASDYERISEYVGSGRTQVILDEAHRVKRGAGGVHGRAVLDLAYVATRRDVLTGTPAPQGAGDLIALVRFLYPGQDRAILPDSAYDDALARDPDTVRETSEAIQYYFARTPKSELGIPDPVWEIIERPMDPIQGAIYKALIGSYRGQLSLSTDSRRQFERLGRIVMYLLEAATNPSLLVAGSDIDDETGFEHPPFEIRGNESLAALLEDYGQYEMPWKYKFVIDAVKTAARQGQKVLIWSTFVRNIHALARELRAFNPAVIHGGIRPADSAPNGSITRESELERFRNDPTCTVLLANPAAAGEGISLHHWCHHAIFLDRTFNAGQFLQSQDRIHRLGLSADVVTRFTLLLSEDSIDAVVDGRLREKVRTLAQLMNDPGLVRVALPESDEDRGTAATDESDATVIADYIRSGSL